ncbi:MAG: HEAT repeat domain-containing protein [Caldilineaceae bacterium]|jgi:HEAT repeat protein
MDESITVQRLKLAIAAQEDELAEKLVQRLAGPDEPALIAMAGSDDPEARWWAVRALAQVGSDQSVDTVAAALHDDDSALRAAAALAIAHLYAREPAASKPALPMLANMLTDDDGLVRQSAADALAMCGDDAVESLASIIDTLQGGARARAAYSLRKICTPRAGELLYPLLDDPNHLVRSYAYDGLDDLGAFENIVIRN